MSDLTHFPTGAIRDDQTGKNNWTETISWTALNRYAKYMTGKREKYGAGNFKKGIPITSYEESIPRHWHKYFTNKYERGNDEPEEDHLAAIIFNVLGIMHEEEMAKKDNPLTHLRGDELTEAAEGARKVGEAIIERHKGTGCDCAWCKSPPQEETECAIGCPENPARYKPRTEETEPLNWCRKPVCFVKVAHQHMSPDFNLPSQEETEKEGASFSGRRKHRKDCADTECATQCRGGTFPGCDTFSLLRPKDTPTPQSKCFKDGKIFVCYCGKCENDSYPLPADFPQSREQGGEKCAWAICQNPKDGLAWCREHASPMGFM